MSGRQSRFTRWGAKSGSESASDSDSSAGAHNGLDSPSPPPFLPPTVATRSPLSSTPTTLSTAINTSDARTRSRTRSPFEPNERPVEEEVNWELNSKEATTGRERISSDSESGLSSRTSPVPASPSPPLFNSSQDPRAGHRVTPISRPASPLTPEPLPAEDVSTSEDVLESHQPLEPDHTEPQEQAKGVLEKKPGFGARLKRIFQTMRHRMKEICVLVVISVSVLAALSSGPLATRKTPAPVKLFDASSAIVDYEMGQLSKLANRALESDVSFVMYYAPWDADCIRFKKEFETVAKHYNYQIFFAAINCWWPQGECSKNIRLKRYPLFLAHVRNSGEVEYRGPLVASYIIPFLDNLLDPVIPLQGDGDLLELRSKHDSVVVGYYDFNESPHPQGYKNFISAAVKSLTVDPWRRVAFSVITSRKVAYKLKITAPSSVTLYLWNSTYEFTTEGKGIKSDAIVRWVYETLNKGGSLVEWLTPTGVKSNGLANVLTKRATFVLFTPRSLILGISPYFDVLREVAMDYYNCDESPIVRSMIHRSILRRHVMEEKLMELEEKCHELQAEPYIVEAAVAWNTSAVMEGDTCCHSQTVKWRPPGKPADKKCYCTACVHVSLAKCPGGCKRFNCLATASRYLAAFEPSDANSTAKFCNQIKSTYQPKYTPYYKIITSCSGVTPTGAGDEVELKMSADSEDFAGYSGSETVTSGLSGSNTQRDEKIERMVQSFESQFCQRLHLGLNYSDLNFPDSGEATASSQTWRSSFTGLGCKTNQTLSFIALDSVLFPSFAENLGIEVFNETHATVSLIIETSKENIYLLDHDLASKSSQSTTSTTISKRSMYEFIKNYTSGALPRFQRSSLAGRTSSSQQCLTESDGRNIVCVPEITSDAFKDIVLDKTKDVILMYYTPWCGFCTSIAHIYLSVARFFLGVEGILFARLNADKNELPFEYTVDRYPTILFFPSKNKADSVVFPQNMPITTTSLVQFVLANSQPSVRYQTSFQLCNRPCLVKNLAAYSSQWRKNSRRVKVINNEIQLINKKLRDKKILVPRTKRLQYQEYVKHLVLMLKTNKMKFRSMFALRQSLTTRINHFDTSYSRELGQELLQDMMMIIQQPFAGAFTSTSDKPAKAKTRGKAKTSAEEPNKAKKKGQKKLKMKDEL